MSPLSLPIQPAHCPVHECDRTRGQHDRTQRLPAPKERGGVYGEAHEDVSRAVDDHQTVYELLVCRRHGPPRELEEGECVRGAQDGVEAEAEEDGPDCGRDEEEDRGTGDGHGCCARSCLVRISSCG